MSKKLWIPLVIIFGIIVLPMVIASALTLVYLFIAQPHKVSGSAMAPTLTDQQYFMTNKFDRNFKRGDIIVFKNPKNESQDFLKRIIGIPGDKVKIEQGKVYINGNILDETYLPAGTITTTGAFMSEEQEITVAENNYFVLGDKRMNSADSRQWGFVPKENIIGKFWFKY